MSNSNSPSGGNNNNNHASNGNNDNNVQQAEESYRPPISCICVTNNARPATLPPPLSVHVILRMPRVPFVVNRRTHPDGPNIAVTCGVVPLNYCNCYEDFMSEFDLAYFASVGEVLPFRGTSPADGIEGFRLWYETINPVRTNVAFGTHTWEVFRARARLVVLLKL